MDPTSAPVSEGTTIMAASYDGGVILCADTRTTAGIYIVNRARQKMTAITDYVSMLRSGSAADTQNIADYLQNIIQRHQAEQQRPATVSAVASIAQLLSYNNKNNITAGLIVAGWDEVKGGQVFGLPQGGTLVPLPFAMGGSGSVYVMGYLEKNWKDGMSYEECKELVVKCMSLAITFDASSGGSLRMVHIGKDGSSTEYVSALKVPIGNGGVEAPVSMVLG